MITSERGLMNFILFCCYCYILLNSAATALVAISPPRTPARNSISIIFTNKVSRPSRCRHCCSLSFSISPSSSPLTGRRFIKDRNPEEKQKLFLLHSSLFDDNDDYDEENAETEETVSREDTFTNSSSSDNEEKTIISDGEDLAKEFYRQLRERQQQQLPEEKEGNEDDDDAKESTARIRNEKPFSQRSVVSSVSSTDDESGDSGNSSNSEPSLPPKIKYTGRSTPPPSSSSSSSSSRFFGSPTNNGDGGGGGGYPGYSSSSLSSSPSPNGRQRIIEQEFNLVGRASSGQALGFQAIIVTLTLIFYIYVGLSGGITSYDRTNDVDDIVEDQIYGFEQVIPVPTDRETSVWL